MKYTDLREYQQQAIDFLYERDNSLVLAEMGAGKTIIAATAASELIDNHVLNRILIVAPLRVCQLVWPGEVNTWDHINPKLFGYAIGPADHRKFWLEDETKKIVVINYDNLAWLVKHGYQHMFDGVIFDEVTRMKNAKAKRFQSLRNWIPYVEWKVGMTGTFPGDKLEDAWGQAFVVDAGKSLGRSKTLFLQRFFDIPDRYSLERGPKPKPGAEKEIARAISDMTFQLKAEDYKDQLPEVVTNMVSCALSIKARDKYEQLKEECWIEELEHTEVTALCIKLQQLADGFVYNSMGVDGEMGSAWIHDAKMDAMSEIMDQASSPVLCVYKYKAELYELRKRWPGPFLGGGVNSKDAEQAVADWNSGRLPVLYIHPASAGHGLNLQRGGHTLVWYGLPWSREEYDQTVARLHRSGQEHTVFVHQLVSVNTVDHAILTALREKKQLNEVFVNDICGTSFNHHTAYEEV